MKYRDLLFITTVLIAASTTSVGANNTVAGDVQCTIFPPAQVVPGEPFDVRVSRVPGYPGGWFSPTMILQISYPTSAGWEYVQRDLRTVPKVGVIRLDATLMAPRSLYPDTDGGFVPGGTVKIVALLREPAGAGYIDTVCAVATAMAP